MKSLVFFFTLLVAAKGSPKFIQVNNLFTCDVYNELANSENGNILVSPFSAETVFAFVQSGARGETAKELRKALHLPNGKTKVEAVFKNLLPKLKSHNYTLQAANKIYVQENFPIKEKFKTTARNVYHAAIEPVDFTQSAAAAKYVNGWVKKHTHNKIKDLINPSDLNNDTRAVLVNGLYFKANWSNPFYLSYTTKANFYKTPTKTVNVDTLHHEEKQFPYYKCPHLRAQFLELPFKGGEASMVIVLPNKKDGLGRLENNLEQVFGLQQKLTVEYINVALPKFKIKTNIDLKRVLENLGVEKVFNETEADLTGIARISRKKENLYINKAAQKTFIEVSEEGVEAAAATYVSVFVYTSARLHQPKNFVADHPFIFYIKVNDLIIFAGRVTDPSKS